MSISEQDLLASLALAYRDSQAREQFYQHVLAAPVYVAAEVPAAGDTPATLKTWDMMGRLKMLPFYTSPEKFAQMLPEEKMTSLSGQQLFEKVRDAVLIMNPGFEPQKEFYPEEVDILLEEGPAAAARDAEPVSDDEVQAMQAAPEIPLSAVDSRADRVVAYLENICAQNPDIRRAYIARYGTPADGEGLIVGVDADRDIFELLERSQQVIENGKLSDLPVSLYPMAGDPSAVTQYFNMGGEPFYRRALGDSVSQGISDVKAGLSGLASDVGDMATGLKNEAVSNLKGFIRKKLGR